MTDVATVDQVDSAPEQPSIIDLPPDLLVKLRGFIFDSVSEAMEANRPAVPAGPGPDVWVAVHRDAAAPCPTCRMPEMVYIAHHENPKMPDKTRRGCANPMCPDQNRPEQEYLPNG